MRRRTDVSSLRSGLIVTGSTLAILMAPALAVASSIDVLGSAAHTGLHGARVSLDSSGDAYVMDQTPSAEASYVVRYYVNTSDLLIELDTEQLDQFVAFNDPDGDGVGGTEEFWVSLRQTGCQAADNEPVGDVSDTTVVACTAITANGIASGDVVFRAGNLITLGDGFRAGGPGDSFTAEVSTAVKAGETRVFVTADTGSGTVTSGVTGTNEELVLPAGWNAIEVTWTAAVNGGTIDLCVNGGSCLTSGPLAHGHAGRIDHVQWGARTVGPNASGHMDLDDFDSRRAGPIGLVP